ncbi:MAG: hypothetical protein IT378_07865 [Sandaracinaceae bacterium]|nr:hypothetical protein [Sandaracinaceae bacterium]
MSPASDDRDLARVLGSVLGGSTMIAGFVLIFVRDHADIHEGAIRF